MQDFPIKKPIFNRIFCFYCLFAMVSAGEGVPVEELLKALHQSQGIQMEKEWAGKLKKVVASDQPREPWEIAWSRENQPGSEKEDFLSIQRSFPTPAFKRVQKKLARTESEQVGMGFSRYMTSLELELQEKFYEGLRIQIEIEIRSNYLREFDLLVQKLAHRVQEGIGPAYDLQRLRQQQVLEKQIIQSLETDYTTLLVDLKILCMDTIPITGLSGNLLPVWDASRQDEALSKIETNQELESQRLELSRLSHKQAQFQRGSISHFNLEIGAKQIKDGSQSGKGNIIGFSVPLSIGDPYAARRARYRTQGKLREMQYERKRASLKKKLENLSHLITKRIAQCNGLQKTLIEPAISLSQMKAQAYRNGGGSLADLLDSRRHLLESYLQTLEISYKARMAWLKFERLLTGVYR